MIQNYSPIFIIGKCENTITIFFIIVYKKLIKIPLISANIGNIKFITIKNNPMYIKIVIKGETTVEAIIPNGQNVPKSFSEIGAVKNCAEVEAATEELMEWGINLINDFVNNSENNKIPAKAP